MNVKDIKKSLKEEHSNKDVPDVLSRAKRAPINKLLMGQTPLRAFDKAHAVRLLWIVTAILLVAVPAVFAFIFLPFGKIAAIESYVRIEIEDEGGTDVIGIVFGNGTVVTCLAEQWQSTPVEQNLNKDGESAESAIKDVYLPKNNDKVRVWVFCKDEEVAVDMAQSIKNIIEQCADGIADIDVSATANDKAMLATWAEYCGCSGEESVDVIIDRYLLKVLE